MPLAYDIVLPRSAEPCFPARCVVCASASEGEEVRVPVPGTWFLALFVPILAFFGWRRVGVPVCSFCRRRFCTQRWIREGVTWMVVLAVVFGLMPQLSELQPNTRKVLVIAAAGVALLPWMLVEVLWPRPFDMTAFGRNLEYEFQHAEVGYEFHQLNEHQLVRSDFESDEDADASVSD